jgi:hypothetical protein
MGYEILYKYKEATDTPGVYSEEVKERSAKIGRVTEDVSLEAVAAKVMTQLARRNIFIVDVEIYEYAKKRVTYRETPTGIVIKNKKFSFDAGSVVETGEFEEEQSADEGFKPLPSPSKEMADRSCPLSRPSEPRKRPIKHEVFDPEPLSLHKAQQKGLKLTVGNKYPVFSEESIGSSVVYTTTDDKGREIKVGAEYFVAMGSGLVQQDDGPTYVGAENQKTEINLWGNYEHGDVPEIRRR